MKCGYTTKSHACNRRRLVSKHSRERRNKPITVALQRRQVFTVWRASDWSPGGSYMLVG